MGSLRLSTKAAIIKQFEIRVSLINLCVGIINIDEEQGNNNAVKMPTQTGLHHLIWFGSNLKLAYKIPSKRSRIKSLFD